MTELPPTNDVVETPPGAAPEHLDSADAPPQAPKHRRSFYRELPVLVLIAFVLAIVIKTFFVQAFFIPSESMVPTLQIGDRVLVNKLVYHFREPRRGEILVFVAEKDTSTRSLLQKIKGLFTEGLGAASPGERDFIKRCIALPGETIEVRAGTVFITPVYGDRFQLTEPYLSDVKDDSSFGPFTVPPDSYFMMGDNRTRSADSRTSLGPIRRSAIIGKAFVRVWPFNRVDSFDTPRYPNEKVPSNSSSGNR